MMVWINHEGQYRRFVLFLCATIVLTVCLRIVAAIAYNVFYHPTKAVPGPFLAKITAQYMALDNIKGTRAHTLTRLHEQYGPFVRIGPNEVSLQDFRLYRQIYNQSSSIKETSFYSSSKLIGHESIFTMRGKKQHSARRKMQSKPYSQHAINENEPLITEMAERLVRRILSASVTNEGKSADAYHLCGLFSLEVICRAAFNQDIGADGMSRGLDFLQTMEDTGGTFFLGIVFPILLKWRLGEHLPGSVGRAFVQRRRWEEITRQLFHDFRAQSKSDTTERFVATPFLYSHDEYLGRTLTEDECVEEAMGLVFAGSGTTAITLVYVLYHMSRPDSRPHQLRLREEVQAAGSNLSNLKDLPFLNAVIKETMRLNPSLAGTLPRTLTVPIALDKDKDVLLLPGTNVSMQNLVHQRDPSVYEDPLAFNPQRWIDLSPSSDAEKALTPFSLGPRNCIGQNLAKAELYLAVSAVFRQLELRLDEEMTVHDMEMVDRFAAIPVGKRLLLNVTELKT